MVQTRGLIDSFDGVAEKFYSYLYALFLNNLLPTKFDDKTLTNTLMSELANKILVHLSGCKHLENFAFQGILLVLFAISIV